MNKEVLMSYDLFLQMQGNKLLNYPSKILPAVGAESV